LVINRDRVGAGQRRDLELRVLALADSELGCAAGVRGVIGVTALVDEHAGDGAFEGRRIIG
jgi:hypothetical protein